MEVKLITGENIDEANSAEPNRSLFIFYLHGAENEVPPIEVYHTTEMGPSGFIPTWDPRFKDLPPGEDFPPGFFDEKPSVVALLNAFFKKLDDVTGEPTSSIIKEALLIPFVDKPWGLSQLTAEEEKIKQFHLHDGIGRSEADGRTAYFYTKDRRIKRFDGSISMIAEFLINPYISMETGEDFVEFDFRVNYGDSNFRNLSLFDIRSADELDQYLY